MRFNFWIIILDTPKPDKPEQKRPHAKAQSRKGFIINPKSEIRNPQSCLNHAKA